MWYFITRKICSLSEITGIFSQIIFRYREKKIVYENHSLDGRFLTVNLFSIFLLNFQKIRTTKIPNDLRGDGPWANVKYRQYFIHLLFLRMPEASFNILAKTGLPCTVEVCKSFRGKMAVCRGILASIASF